MSTYLIFLCNSLSLAHRFRSTQRVQCGEMPTNSSPTNNPRQPLNASIASEDTIGPGKNSRKKKDFTGNPAPAVSRENTSAPANQPWTNFVYILLLTKAVQFRLRTGSLGLTSPSHSFLLCCSGVQVARNPNPLPIVG